MAHQDAVPQPVSPEADTGVMELPVRETPAPDTLKEVKELLQTVLREVRTYKADQDLLLQAVQSQGLQIAAQGEQLARILASLDNPQVEIESINVHVDPDPEGE